MDKYNFKVNMIILVEYDLTLDKGAAPRVALEPALSSSFQLSDNLDIFGWFLVESLSTNITIFGVFLSRIRHDHNPAAKKI